MALRSIFPRIYTASLSVAVSSQDASVYLFNFLFILGIRPPPKRFTLLYLLWSFLLGLLATFYQPIGFLISYVIHRNEFSPSAFLTSAQVAFNVWACSFKVIILWLRVHNLDKANAVLDKLDNSCVNEDEKHKIRRTVARCNFIFFLFVFLYMSYIVMTFTNSMINGRPPYQSYFPFIEWRKNQLHFWIQATLELLSIIGAALQNACVDSYPIIYILIIRMHVQLLTERVRNLGTDPKLDDDNNYNNLVQCIYDHKTILSFSSKIHAVVSGTIFVQFMALGIVTGLILINIMLFADFYSGMGSFSYLCAVLLETTPLCVLCNILTDDCEKLADGVFQSNWTDKPQKYKKTLLQFLHNTQQPIEFTAMNVFPITVATNIQPLDQMLLYVHYTYDDGKENKNDEDEAVPIMSASEAGNTVTRMMDFLQTPQNILDN